MEVVDHWETDFPVWSPSNQSVMIKDGLVTALVCDKKDKLALVSIIRGQKDLKILTELGKCY